MTSLSLAGAAPVRQRPCCSRRKGYRVLMVDKSTFPSDQILSTHLVWPRGIACLDRWGLLPEVIASGCPALSKARFDVGPVVLSGGFPPADGEIRNAYAPRRTVLDQILVQGAIAAGAELREGCAMTGLLSDEHGTVCGVALRSRDGSHTERASIVIGADGLYSSVASAVKAVSYATYPALRHRNDSELPAAYPTSAQRRNALPLAGMSELV